MRQSEFERELAVAEMLAELGRHRGAKPADLIIAAAAEAQDLTLLHYDDDRGRIAAVTASRPPGWPTEAPRPDAGLVLWPTATLGGAQPPDAGNLHAGMGAE